MLYARHVLFIEKISSARAGLAAARQVVIEENLVGVAQALEQAEDRIGHAINVLRDHEEARWKASLQIES